MNSYTAAIDPNLVTDYNLIPLQARIIDTREDIPEEEQNRVLTKNEILRLIDQTGLDLWCVAPEAPQKVYKLLDYGRFRFDQRKKQRENSKKQRETVKGQKEYYFTPGMAEHDYQIKLTQVRDALPTNDIRIGMKINFKTRSHLGRHINLYALAQDPEFVLNRVIKDLAGMIQETRLQVGEKIVTANLRGL